MDKFNREFTPGGIFMVLLIMASEKLRVQKLGFTGDNECEYRRVLRSISVNVPTVKLSDLIGLICQGSHNGDPDLFYPLGPFESRIVCFGLQEKETLSWEDVEESAVGGFGYFSKSKDRVYDLVFGVKYGQSVCPVLVKVDLVNTDRSADDVGKVFADIRAFSESICPRGNHIALVVEFGDKIETPCVERVSLMPNQLGYRIRQPDLEPSFHEFMIGASEMVDLIMQEMLHPFQDE